VSPGAGHDHDHDHVHAHATTVDTRPLKVNLALVVSYIFVEFLGGLYTGSLALLADASHMLSDAAAMGIALFALSVAARPADARHTYGHHRAEVLAAVANGALLFALGIGVGAEAWERWWSPPEVDALPMLGIAAGGLAINIVALFLLSGGRANMSIRSAWLHAASDALGSVGAIAAAGAMVAFGWRWADPVASVLIAVLVIRSAARLLGEAAAVLMESSPVHIDVDRLRAAMLSVPRVTGVHDLHVWTLSPGRVAMSGHVVVDDESAHCSVLRLVADRLREDFGIDHATIQVEPPGYEEAGTHP
jgi:cobalt-zinc-cadmium efflux system protein